MTFTSIQTHSTLWSTWNKFKTCICEDDIWKEIQYGHYMSHRLYISYKRCRPNSPSMFIGCRVTVRTTTYHSRSFFTWQIYFLLYVCSLKISSPAEFVEVDDYAMVFCWFLMTLSAWLPKKPSHTSRFQVYWYSKQSLQVLRSYHELRSASWHATNFPSLSCTSIWPSLVIPAER